MVICGPSAPGDHKGSPLRDARGEGDHEGLSLRVKRSTPERGQMLRRACCKPVASVFQHGSRRQTAGMEVGSTTGAAVRIALPSLDQLFELHAHCSLPPAADRRRLMSAPRGFPGPWHGIPAPPSSFCHVVAVVTLRGTFPPRARPLQNCLFPRLFRACPAVGRRAESKRAYARAGLGVSPIIRSRL